MKGSLDVHRALLERDIPHEVLRLRHLISHADDLPDVLGVDADQCVHVRVFVGAGTRAAVATEAGRPPLISVLREMLDEPTLRAATAAETNEATEYAAGLVSPLLLPPELPLYVDARLGTGQLLYTPTGDTGNALAIPTRDLLMLTAARVAVLSQPSLVDLTHPDEGGHRPRRVSAQQ